MTLESGRLPSTWTFHCCSHLCLPTSQFLFNSEVGQARPVKWLCSPHGPTQGLVGPITSTFSWNLLSKLARMCSGYERGSHPLLHGSDDSREPPGSWAAHHKLLQGLSEEQRQGASPVLRYWSTKRKKLTLASKDSLPKQPWGWNQPQWPTGGKKRVKRHHGKTVTFAYIKGKCASFQLQA